MQRNLCEYINRGKTLTTLHSTYKQQAFMDMFDISL